MPLRAMTEADVEAVLALEAACVTFPWTENQLRASVAAHDCQVLDTAQGVAGFSIFALQLDEAGLLNIAVTPALQGQGYGRWLLEQGLQRMARLGAERCYLEVRVSNRTAQTLYRSLGFELVGRRRGYYPAIDGREDGLVMSRPLPITSLAVS